MKIFVNERMVASRARLGKIATVAGLGLLVAGFIVSVALPPVPYVWISLGCLLFGIVLSTIGTSNMNRWVKQPRADQVLARGLKGFDDRYRLYNYTLPAPHVLLSPAGLYVLTAMGQEGVIRYEDGKWRRDFSAARLLRFMVDEGMGQPFAQADDEVRRLGQFLEKNGLADGVEIESLVVFTNQKAQLAVKDAPRPVLTPKDLKRAVRRDEKRLSGERYRRLMELFEAQ